MMISDIPVGMRLREIAGWNQTEADWRRFLQLHPGGCFVALADGRVCGTVTTLNYQNRFGWVGMVLVDPEFRRHGIGIRLLDTGIQSLEKSGVPAVKLDATPMGRPLYLQRGFADEYGIERWEGTAPLQISDRGIRTEASAATVKSEVQASRLPVMTVEDVAQVCHRDREIFGADRSRLLTALWQENPSLTAVGYSGDEVAGYILGRAGSRAFYLGPWVAEDVALARRLFAEFLVRLPGEKIFVDVCLENSHAKALAQQAGFQFQRPLMRMCRGPNRYPGNPQLVCGIAGPELG